MAILGIVQFSKLIEKIPYNFLKFNYVFDILLLKRLIFVGKGSLKVSDSKNLMERGHEEKLSLTGK